MLKNSAAKPGKLIACVLITMFASTLKASDLQSSLFTVLFSGAKVKVNSLQGPSGCSVSYDSNDSGDLEFSFDTITSSYGICYDQKIEAQLQYPQYSTHLLIDIKYYDLLFNQMKITAPVEGYTSKAPAGKNLYFFKTPNNTYGALLKIGEYIGGIDRNHYYMVTNKDIGTALYKSDSAVSIPLKLAVNAFSGRNNPIFTITKNPDVFKLLTSLYNKINKNQLPDPKDEIGRSALSNEFNFTIQNSCLSSSPSNYQIEIGKGKITVTRPSSSLPIIFGDNNILLEKTIIALGQKANPVSHDNYGDLQFIELFPIDTNPVISNWIHLGQIGGGNTSSTKNIFGIDGCKTVSGYTFYFAAGDSGLYSTDVKTNGSVPTPSCQVIKDQSVGTNGIFSIFFGGGMLYAGSKEEGVLTGGPGNWQTYSPGLPLSTTPGKFAQVNSITFNNYHLYAKTYLSKESLSHRLLQSNRWGDALSFYNIKTGETTIDQLPKSLPEEVFKFYIAANKLRKMSDSLYHLITDTSSNISDWDINYVVKSGSALLAVVNNTCLYCSNPYLVFGYILRSTDNGKTWKPVIYKNNFPQLHIVNSGNRLFCSITSSSTVVQDTALWSSGIYKSDDFGDTWIKIDSGLADIVVALKVVDNYLCAATGKGNLYLKDISSIETPIIKGRTQDTQNTKTNKTNIHYKNNNFTLNIPHNITEINFTLCDLQGKTLVKNLQKLNSNMKVSLPDVRSGVYLLKVSAGPYNGAQKVILR